MLVRDPIVLDFDGIASGVAITNQYPSATFASDPGFVNWSDTRGRGSLPSNVFATGSATGGIDGLHDTFVDFSSPVVALTLKAVDVDNVGPVATFLVYETGIRTATVPLDGVGDPAQPVVADLTAYHDVTRIELVNLGDPNGIAWDDFAFGLSTVASWSNYGAGFPGTNGVSSLTVSANPIFGTIVMLNVGSSARATTSALLLAGLQSTSIPTSKGGVLLVAPLLIIPLPLPPTGAQISGTLPDDASLCGLSLFAQAIEVDAGAAKGLSFSPGLELLLGY